MLRWMKSVAEVDVYQRWVKHFEVLCNLPYFQDEFPAVRAFDISERATYFTTPFTYVAEVWWTRLHGMRQEIATKANREEIQELRAELSRSGGPIRTNRTDRASPVRNQPYPSSSPARSFPDSKPAITTRRVCLRCGRPNEVASQCTHTTTFRGRPVISRYDTALRTLVAVDGRSEFCFQFNFGGRCRGGHADRIKDVCSVCGGEDHHAAGGNCPV